jgi:hypothetical protein
MRKYVLNPETLIYEIKEVSLKHKILKSFLLFAGSVGLAFLYAWLFSSCPRIRPAKDGLAEG